MAMCGPRDLKAEVSVGTAAGGLVMAGAGANAVLAGVLGVLLGKTESLARRKGSRLTDDLRERFSFKTRRQNRMSPDGEALIPFCESSSLTAR